MTDNEILKALRLEQIVGSRAVHQGEEWVRLGFERDSRKEMAAKKVQGSVFSYAQKAWLLPASRKALIAFLGNLGHEGQEGKLSEAMVAKVDAFIEWLRSRRYSENTVKTYSEALRTFLRFYWNKPLSEISNQDLISFNNTYIIGKKLSASYQNQIVNAIKLFFDKVEGSKMRVDLVHRPKRAHVLPKVLSMEEVSRILNALENIKHKCMLSLIYSAGLRRSELLRMRIRDIDSMRMQLFIHQSKGRKDRIVPLSETILLLLRTYYVAYNPTDYLFEGREGDQYSERSLALVLKRACHLAGIRRQVNLHMLRHSYATHLLESGTDLRFIQELLGHRSSRTTEIYTHVSQSSINRIVSPLDRLGLKI
jgi:integrase/recombinase XerD